MPPSKPTAASGPDRAPRADRRAAKGRRSPRGKELTIGILSRNPKLYSTRRLVESCKKLGHRALVLDTLRCNLVLGSQQPRVFYQGAEVRHLDALIPRIGASVTGYGLSVVSQFDMMGVPVLNNAVAIGRSRDKLRALQILSRHGIDIPRTVMCRYREEVPQALEQVGGLPCVVKLIQGTQGVGVMIATSVSEIRGMLDTLWTLGQEILIQELIAESRGRDVRALVVGDRVVAAMRRRARTGEFRSNLHRGGEGRRIDLTPEYADVAVRAAQVIGLEAAGVDMLEAKSGPKIMEVNSSPGFRGIEQVTGADIAASYVEHAVRLARARSRSPLQAPYTRG